MNPKFKDDHAYPHQWANGRLAETIRAGSSLFVFSVIPLSLRVNVIYRPYE